MWSGCLSLLFRPIFVPPFRSRSITWFGPGRQGLRVPEILTTSLPGLRGYAVTVARVSMRKVLEVIRLAVDAGRSQHETGPALGLAQSTDGFAVMTGRRRVSQQSRFTLTTLAPGSAWLVPGALRDRPFRGAEGRSCTSRPSPMQHPSRRPRRA